MKGVDTSTAAAGNQFTDGDPSTAVAATNFNARWCNDVQNEILNVITTSGQTPEASVNQLLKGILMMVYPVGSLYWTGNLSANPATLFGFGTWSKVSVGRAPWGYSSSDANFNAVAKQGGAETVTLSSSNLPAHTHSVAQHTHTIATHTHAISATHTHGIANHSHTIATHSHAISATHTHTVSAHTHTIATHNHKNGMADEDTAMFVYGSTTTDVPGAATKSLTDLSSTPVYQGLTETAGPTVTGSSGSGSTGSAAPGSTDSGGTTTTGSGGTATSNAAAPGSTDSGGTTVTGTGGPTVTGSTGTGTAVSILPPYEVVGNIWKRTA